MIRLLSKVKIIDNSGGLWGKCIDIVQPKDKSQKSKFGRVGDLILISITKTIPGSKYQKGDIIKALIVRTKSSSPCSQPPLNVQFHIRESVLKFKRESDIRNKNTFFGWFQKEIELFNLTGLFHLNNLNTYEYFSSNLEFKFDQTKSVFSSFDLNAFNSFTDVSRFLLGFSLRKASLQKNVDFNEVLSQKTFYNLFKIKYFNNRYNPLYKEFLNDWLNIENFYYKNNYVLRFFSSKQTTQFLKVSHLLTKKNDTPVLNKKQIKILPLIYKKNNYSKYWLKRNSNGFYLIQNEKPFLKGVKAFFFKHQVFLKKSLKQKSLNTQIYSKVYFNSSFEKLNSNSFWSKGVFAWPKFKSLESKLYSTLQLEEFLSKKLSYLFNLENSQKIDNFWEDLKKNSLIRLSLLQTYDKFAIRTSDTQLKDNSRLIEEILKQNLNSFWFSFQFSSFEKNFFSLNQQSQLRFDPSKSVKESQTQTNKNAPLFRGAKRFFGENYHVWNDNNDKKEFFQHLKSALASSSQIFFYFFDSIKNLSNKYTLRLSSNTSDLLTQSYYYQKVPCAFTLNSKGFSLTRYLLHKQKIDLRSVIHLNKEKNNHSTIDAKRFENSIKITKYIRKNKIKLLNKINFQLKKKLKDSCGNTSNNCFQIAQRHYFSFIFSYNYIITTSKLSYFKKPLREIAGFSIHVYKKNLQYSSFIKETGLRAFNDNAVVLVKTNVKDPYDYIPLGSRIKGPICNSMKKTNLRVYSITQNQMIMNA